MEILQLSGTQLALLGTLIIGVTELLNRLRAKDFWVVTSIVTAALVGGLLALYYKVDFVSGLAAGLSASGVLKSLSIFGNKSTPAPSEVLDSRRATAPVK